MLYRFAFILASPKPKKVSIISHNKNYSRSKKYETKIAGKFEIVIYRKYNILESNLDTVIYKSNNE